MAPPAVVARGLTKRFGDLTAVDGIDVTVAAGETFAFLGANGAGKTSAMRMIATVSPVTDGELSVLGLDPHHDGQVIRSRLGVVPQEDNLDLELTVRENLLVYGLYHGLPRTVIAHRIDDLLAFAQLEDKADAEVDALSGGMKRRLTIARALINEPDLVILDEPTTGLDPQARHVLWDRLHELRSRGVTLLLTTHYMDEAEQLADRLVVMDHGRIIAEGSPTDLIVEHVTREVLEVRFGTARQAESSDRLVALDLPEVESVEQLAERAIVYTRDAEATLDALGDHGLVPRGHLTRRATLEDVFLRLTGRQLVD
ncbi:ABC transporter ATP-binding protein [Salsipaludibacter albus]|uniref:ABC transporter ATP-binding protein n=1 Tax=Salsipaludibacter albus TaxID=2849650 RepID=UPI001EE48F48|nr:ATP-binding cassette domain-containing protein [Salsipaludibacter albus]MBY5164132.1 ATP-binding cassette domain-containing protein [Salsipaludibacter albus]